VHYPLVSCCTNQNTGGFNDHARDLDPDLRFAGYFGFVLVLSWMVKEIDKAGSYSKSLEAACLLSKAYLARRLEGFPAAAGVDNHLEHTTVSFLCATHTFFRAAKATLTNSAPKQRNRKINFRWKNGLTGCSGKTMEHIAPIPVFKPQHHRPFTRSPN
jgi:hypothetical protein